MSYDRSSLKEPRGPPEGSLSILPECVPIFVQESVNRIPDLSRIVFDSELQRIHARPRVDLVEGMIVMTFFQVRDVTRFREIAFVVEEMQDADGLLSNQVDDLGVVGISQRSPFDPLLGVFGLLEL